MSNQVNTDLHERAALMLDEWDNTLHAKLIEQALANNDLDELYFRVTAAENALEQLEAMDNDVF